MTLTDTDLERERQRLLDELLAAEGLGGEGASSPIVPRDQSQPAPVTFAQEVLWLLDRATPGLTAYNSPIARRIRGALDVSALERALTTLVSRHDSLRTIFESRGDGTVQVVLPPAPVTLVRYDAKDERSAISALRAVADTAFDLSREPAFRAALARIADDDHILLLLTHHIVSDAWSYGLIFRELSALYSDANSLPTPTLQFGDYAAWQRETLQGEQLAERLGYWRQQLADLPVLDLPTEQPRSAQQQFGGARREIVLSPALSASLTALAHREGGTLYMALLSAYAIVLGRYASQSDVVIGSAVAGRTRREMEEMIGYFSQALPMRVKMSRDMSFAALLRAVSDTVLSAFDHQDVPLDSLILDLQREAGTPSHAPLFRTVLTMQDAGGADLTLGATTTSPVELETSGTKFDLTLLATDGAKGIELSLWYRTDLFSATYAGRFLAHFARVLEQVTAQPARPIARVSLLTAEERTEVARTNATNIDLGEATTFTELFARQVVRVGERAALIAGSRSGAREVLTYSQLDARANQVAHHLGALGVTGNSPVGLLLDRSRDAMVGLLGILRAGAAYVPLSVDAPASRIATQLGECGASVVITSVALRERVPATVAVVVIDGDDDATLGALPTTPPAVTYTPEDIAYILYTSGSTGTPKGVAVTHANAVNYARAVGRVLGNHDGWHFGMVSTLAADLGNTSLLVSLAGGGTLHVLSKEDASEPARFAEYAAAHPLDVLKITPNHLAALVAGKQGSALHAVLPRRWVVTGGEALRFDVAKTLLDAGTCRVLNHYGPTEATVGACTFEVTRESLAMVQGAGAQTVPVGMPLANVHAHVVDLHGNEQPDGIPGELLIGGAGVARGYFRRPELTAERFIEWSDGEWHERVYRTGDRTRRLQGGAIEFLGRTDDQVKVRGHRVELGEVEHALRAHPGVAQGVVVVRDEDLIAYAVAKQAGYAVSHSDRPTVEKIRAYLAAQLPEYMVPRAVVLLDALPLTANGKIDKGKLPSTDAGVAAGADSFVAPRTEMEQQLAAIWAEVLKKDRIGVNESFLALGGHSLLAIRVLGKISKSFGVRLPLRLLFENATVEVLAGEIARLRG